MYQKILIIINGKPGAGKDQFSENLAKDYSVENLSSVTLVKEAIGLLGWDGEKTPEARNFMSNVKDAWTLFNDGPFQYIVEKVVNSKADIVIAHVREPKEIEKLKTRFIRSNEILAVKICIDRPIEVVATNHADNNTNAIDYDYIVQNHGTLEEFEKSSKETLFKIFDDHMLSDYLKN